MISTIEYLIVSITAKGSTVEPLALRFPVPTIKFYSAPLLQNLRLSRGRSGLRKLLPVASATLSFPSCERVRLVRQVSSG